MESARLFITFVLRSCLATFAVLLSPGFASEALSQSPLPLHYTAKFACGVTDGKVLARGHYFTAVNVHNLTDQSIKMSKMFTIGLPGEKAGGHTEFREDAVELEPHDSLEVDCDDIVERARQLCSAQFCKGFVVIETNAQLEVVTVYSAADLNTNQVTTLHTDRVSPRCPVRIDTVPTQTILFVPPDVGGRGGADPDFDGHGPCVDFKLSLEVEDGDKSLSAKYQMNAYECSGDFGVPRQDFTAAAGRDELVLKVASPQGRILGHDQLTSMGKQYVDTNHDDDEFMFDPPFPVEKLVFVGDTVGDESGTRTGVFITLREIKIELESCALPPPEIIIR